MRPLWLSSFLHGLLVASLRLGQPQALSQRAPILPVGFASPVLKAMPHPTPTLTPSPYSTGFSGSSCPLIFAQDQDGAIDGYPLNTLLSANPAATNTPTYSPTITSKPPAPSCYLQNEDPDQGINTEYCVCNNKITLPVWSTGVDYDRSCAWSSIPGSKTIDPKPSLPVTTSNCRVCTLAVDEDTCFMLPGCSPTPTPISKCAVSKNPVHVGDLYGDRLYNAVYNAMKSKCPDPSSPGTPTTCSADTVAIDGVSYVIPGSELEESTVSITIEDSTYRTANQRDAMIWSVATAVNGSATGKNCYTTEYNTPCPVQEVIPHYNTAPPSCTNPIQLCNAANEVTTVLVDYPYIHQMSVEISFQVDAFNNEFSCELAFDLIAAALALPGPELAPEDVALLEDIHLLCGELTGETSGESSG